MVYAEKVKESFMRQYPIGTLFPSEIGICVRKSVLARRVTFKKMMGTESTDAGASIHVTVQQYFTATMNCEAEKPVSYNIDGITISGKVDLLCNNDLIELKTTGKTVFTPYANHLMQIAVYRQALKTMGIDVKGTYIVYINRAIDDVQEFHISESQLQTALKQAEDYVRRYNAFKDEKNIKNIPRGDVVFCQHCEFRSICFGDITRFF
ncbi:CRISPR/Cas system associated [Acidianus rod-shaped virus 1]|uniref:PD-(D/E)XK endonuclease-like domain-containing protein n=1 Tax=Acidianus rod-shaped virus 1 TaxID=309181 RepID=Q50I54_9VIRU|nr:CRISPR/Cas system associated [Acidianus rod-shaped virus 1]CAI44172.1 hypothetical protein [Acidianus rod-shaped virus 1]